MGARQRHALVARAVMRMVTDRPVLVWLDDVHNSGEALELATALLRMQAPVLVVLTARDDLGGSDGLSQFLTRGDVRQLLIGGLGDAGASELIRGLLGLHGELADRVERHARGNPMFAVQLVGDWVQRGLLVPGRAGFRLSPGVRIEIPDELHQLWGSRLEEAVEGLGQGARESFEVAAVLGYSFEAQEWREACGELGLPASVKAAARLVRLSLLRPTAAGWTFAHTAARGSLIRWSRESGRWAAQNLACAVARQRLDRGQPGAIGRHLVEAGDMAEGAALLLEGAQAAAARFDLREALALLDRREQALPVGEDDPSRYAGWRLRASVYMKQGRASLARGWAERAHAAARTQAQIAESLCLLGDVAMGEGSVEEARATFTQSVQLSQAMGDAACFGRAVVGLGFLEQQQGQMERAVTLALQARRALEKVDGQQAMIARTVRLEALGAQGVGDFDRSAAMLEQAARAFRSAGDLPGEARCYRSLARVANQRRDWAEAEALVNRALELFEHLGDVTGECASLNGLAEIYRRRGRLEQAELAYRRALGFEGAVVDAHLLVPRLNLALIALEREHWDEADSLLDGLVAAFVDLAVDPMVAGAHAASMALCAATHDLEGFEGHFGACRLLVLRTGLHERDIARCAEIAADHLLSAGERDFGRACLELALQQREPMKGRGAERLRQRLESEFGDSW